MNIADYLSEFLFNNNEVSVPGLGGFLLMRKNAWYNAKEAKFYPPFHEVKFVPHPKHDDTFSQYVAGRENISLESAKYFIEKFIGNLTEQASVKKIPVGNLGWFYKQQQSGNLEFKPNDKIATDPFFFGYTPVIVNTLAGTENKVPSAPQPKTEALPVTTENELHKNGNLVEEETVRKKSVNIWLVLLLVITILALAAVGVYQYKPTAFDSLKTLYQNSPGDNKKPNRPVLKNNTGNDTARKNDTVSSPVPTGVKGEINAVDTTKMAHFEIIAISFKTRTKAVEQIAIYKKSGLDAKIVEDTTGVTLYKFQISVGTYPSRKEAQKKMLALKNEGKIGDDSYSIEIKPKQ